MKRFSFYWSSTNSRLLSFKSLFLILIVTILLIIAQKAVRGEEQGTLQPVAYLPIVLDQTVKNGGWDEVSPNSATANGLSNSAKGAIDPAMATAPNGDVYIAWTEVITFGVNGRSDIYVQKWDGNSWTDVGTNSATGGGISNTNNHSLNPAIAISTTGIPYIAWSDQQSDWQIYVRRLNGDTWEEVSAGSASANGISDTTFPSQLPSIALNSTDTPFVSWQDNSPASIYLRTFNSPNWDEVGTGSATGLGITGSANHYAPFSLAIAPNNMPTIASADNTTANGYDIVVRQWDGNAWQIIGGDKIATASDNTSLHTNDWNPELAIAPNGNIFVAWPDNLQNESYDLRLRQWDGTQWNIVGTDAVQTVVTDHFERQSLDIVIGADGHPVIAWKAYTVPQYNLFAQKWDGTAWTTVGELSASGKGISDNGGDSDNLSLAVAPDGTLYLAWNDDASGTDQIYIRSWKE